MESGNGCKSAWRIGSVWYLGSEVKMFGDGERDKVGVEGGGKQNPGALIQGEPFRI